MPESGDNSKHLGTLIPNSEGGLLTRPSQQLPRIAIAALFLPVLFAVQSAQAQTFQVIHTFSGGGDGYQPYSGLTIDRGGHLYGTTSEYVGGTVFEMKRVSGNWVLNTLLTFNGTDGLIPYSKVVFGTSGALFGTTFEGGTSLNCDTYPYARLTMDAAGSLYGTTSYFFGPESYLGGDGSEGSVFKLAFSGGSWTYIDLHDFDGGHDGGGPFGSVILDPNGNVYGTGTSGGTVLYCSGGCGVVWEITP